MKIFDGMKRTMTMLLLAAISANMSGQTVQDALRFGENRYYGTARTVSMGNAFTALGGDLGSIGINPAGSAVNNYSQFTITPGISIVSTNGEYNAMPTSALKFDTKTHNSKSRFTMPNVGFTINCKTGRKTGLKNVTFGIVANGTSNYLDNMSAGGRNTATSYAGSLAAQVSNAGISASALNGENAYNGTAAWNYITGYQSGIISTFNNSDKDYIGTTEKNYDDGTGSTVVSLADAIDQVYGRQARGSKYDFAFNFGMNFSDVIYAGANVGITSISYDMNEYFKEYAVDPSKFDLAFEDASGNISTTYFNSMRYRYAYDMQSAGIYAKFGIIAVPTRWLRIGAAIQTPTANYVTEHWQHAGETYFENSYFNASATSPKGEYKYKMVTPFIANVGAAVTFGQRGLISADYEICDYSTMKFKETETNDNSAFSGVNQDIKDLAASHSLRLGAEFKIVPQFAVRIGYNWTTSGDANNKKTPKSITKTCLKLAGLGLPLTSLTVLMNSKETANQAFSAGLGYSSKGSFFCDLAVRATNYSKTFTYPYDSYSYDANDNLVLSPEIRASRRLWDVLFTFGWRF